MRNSIDPFVVPSVGHITLTPNIYFSHLDPHLHRFYCSAEKMRKKTKENYASAAVKSKTVLNKALPKENKHAQSPHEQEKNTFVNSTTTSSIKDKNTTLRNNRVNTTTASTTKIKKTTASIAKDKNSTSRSSSRSSSSSSSSTIKETVSESMASVIAGHKSKSSRKDVTSEKSSNEKNSTKREIVRNAKFAKKSTSLFHKDEVKQLKSEEYIHTAEQHDVNKENKKLSKNVAVKSTGGVGNTYANKSMGVTEKSLMLSERNKMSVARKSTGGIAPKKCANTNVKDLMPSKKKKRSSTNTYESMAKRQTSHVDSPQRKKPKIKSEVLNCSPKNDSLSQRKISEMFKGSGDSNPKHKLKCKTGISDLLNLVSTNNTSDSDGFQTDGSKSSPRRPPSSSPKSSLSSVIHGHGRSSPDPTGTNKPDRNSSKPSTSSSKLAGSSPKPNSVSSKPSTKPKDYTGLAKKSTSKLTIKER